jgi:hypothetical protein
MNTEVVQIPMPRGVNRGDLLHALEILIIIGAVFGGWQAFKDTAADHSRRIAIIETEKASKEMVLADRNLTLAAIQEQSRQIGELKEIVRTDHDSIVTINAHVIRKQ